MRWWKPIAGVVAVCVLGLAAGGIYSLGTGTLAAVATEYSTASAVAVLALSVAAVALAVAWGSTAVGRRSTPYW